MLFYFVRHGETEANFNEVLAGSGMDHCLTERGHQQAQTLALQIREHIPETPQRILVSDMTRTQQTARYLSQSLSLPLEIEPDLREWHFGEWEGRLIREFGPLILGNGEPKLGESRVVFYARIEKVWRKLHSNTAPYLLVSHGAVWLALQDILKIPRFAIANCQLIRVSFIDGQWSGKILNH